VGTVIQSGPLEEEGYCPFARQVPFLRNLKRWASLISLGCICRLGQCRKDNPPVRFFPTHLALPEPSFSPLSHKLRHGEVRLFVPTQRPSVEAVEVGNVKFRAWDLGGHRQVLSSLHRSLPWCSSHSRVRYGPGGETISTKLTPSFSLSTRLTLTVYLRQERCAPSLVPTISLRLTWPLYC